MVETLQNGGAAYEVEFARPVVGVATMRAASVSDPSARMPAPRIADGKIVDSLPNVDHVEGGPKAA